MYPGISHATVKEVNIGARSGQRLYFLIDIEGKNSIRNHALLDIP